MTDSARGFPGVGHGDRVHVRFRDAWRENGRVWKEVTGRTTVIVGRLYVAAEGVSGAMGMPVLVSVDPDRVDSLEVLESSAALQERARAAARGVVIYERPGADGSEIRGQLEALAGMIAGLDGMDPRRRQLQHQFDDIADHVELAATKRTYLLTKARLGWGDFNPWSTKTDDVFRIKTVRPIDCDFEPDREKRADRRRRVEQAVRLFGEAERETRSLLSRLRAEGLEARRSHPNGFEIKVKTDVGERKGFDVVLTCGSNGWWEVKLPAENKSEQRRRERAIRRGHPERVLAVLKDWLDCGRNFPAKDKAA